MLIAAGLLLENKTGESEHSGSYPFFSVKRPDGFKRKDEAAIF